LSSLKATVAPADPVQASIIYIAGLLENTCICLHITKRYPQFRNA